MRWRVAFSAVSLLSAVSSAVWAGGLSSSFANVLVRGVPVGAVYVVGGPEGRGLVLKNIGPSTVNIQVQALVPSAAQIKAGVESIPDISWVQLEPATLKVNSNQQAAVRIRLRVPNDPAFKNRMFQVMIWSRAEPLASEGMSYNAALLSTLRFQTLP